LKTKTTYVFTQASRKLEWTDAKRKLPAGQP